jgi:glycosyltransferase involved in cell wall biosynthesis
VNSIGLPSTQLRVIVITPYYKPAHVYGGPSRSVPALCEGLAKLGVIVNVFTTNANGDLNLSDSTIKEVISGVEVTYFQRTLRPFGRFFYARELGRSCRLRMGRYHVAYICGSWVYPTIPARVAATSNRVPFVLSPRGSLMEWALRQKRFKKMLYMHAIESKNISHASAIHCTSKIERDQVVSLRLSDNVVVIPNGIDLNCYDLPFPKGKVRSRFQIPHTAILSLFVGRLHRKKRVERIIQAFSRMVGQFPEHHLMIVGPDEDGVGALARKLVQEMGLSEKIHFVGYVAPEALPDFYKDSDLQIMVSLCENFGMVVVEGMACSLPILVSKEVGISDEIVQSRAGIVVDADTIELENSWAELIRSERVRKELGQNGRDLAKSRFSQEAVARQMLLLFENVISARPARDASSRELQKGQRCLD